jgi:hypothetical protein
MLGLDEGGLHFVEVLVGLELTELTQQYVGLGVQLYELPLEEVLYLGHFLDEILFEQVQGIGISGGEARG